MFAIFTAIIGFLGTLLLTLILMTACLPRPFAEWQRDSKSRLALVGFCIFFIAWIAATSAIASGVETRKHCAG